MFSLNHISQGKEYFNEGSYDMTLKSYNEAILFSTGKGLGHTLARRAAFLLNTDEHLLALRDLHAALQYGCLENELLDLLLDHHRAQDRVDVPVGRKLEKKYSSTYHSRRENSPYVEKIRTLLSDFDGISRLSSEQSKKEKNCKLEEIISCIRCAIKDHDFENNIESSPGGMQTPTLVQSNPVWPALSASVEVVHSAEKGRHMVAVTDIAAGEVICAGEPECRMLCPPDPATIHHHCCHCLQLTKAPIPCEVCKYFNVRPNWGAI